MIRYNYYKLSKTKKIRYIKNNQKNRPYIIFLHGFMSNLEGKKPKAFLKFANKKKLGFLAVEYSGHGKSYGKFTDGNISLWSKETTLLIKKIVKKNDLILIGSSMGSWISLNQFKIFKNQIKGFLGIGSAPEFLENLMWKKFTKKMRNEITIKNIITLNHGKFVYPITLQLIKDGRKNKVLKKKINHKLKVTMVHGEKDESVPFSYSKKILKLFSKAKKKLVIVKKGDHSLSKDKWLKILINELNLIVS
tara:strand:- start:1142 stop:1888 length:747 start_codon:yes stop_codon:yes gene_type:complete